MLSLSVTNNFAKKKKLIRDLMNNSKFANPKLDFYGLSLLKSQIFKYIYNNFAYLFINFRFKNFPFHIWNSYDNKDFILSNY